GGNPTAFREFARAYSTAVTASEMVHSDIDRHLGIKSSSCYWAREDHRGGMPPRHHWEQVRELLNLPDEFVRLYDEAEREVIGKNPWTNSANHFVPGEDHTQRVHTDVTAPATPEAERWAGWGTALKPAIEPVIVARKPLAGTVAGKVLEWGTGALNIDASRVATDDGKPAYAYRNGPGGNTFSVGEGPDGTRTEPTVGSPAGRWPANVLLDHEAAAAMDEQSGVLKTGGPKPSQKSTAGATGWGSGEYRRHDPGGGASRFFPVFKYQAKAPKRERPVIE